MREDALDDGGLCNGRDEFQLPATMRTVRDVDVAIPTARFNNCTQRMRPFVLPAGVGAQSPACAGAVSVGTGPGTTALRSFAFGASTP